MKRTGPAVARKLATGAGRTHPINGCFPAPMARLHRWSGKGWLVDDRLKELMQELGNAINEPLSGSESIAAAIGEIKRAGYDVFLVLEATIGFNKRDESDDDESDAEVEGEEMEITDTSSAPNQRFEAAGKIKWTSQDHKFL